VNCRSPRRLATSFGRIRCPLALLVVLTAVGCSKGSMSEAADAAAPAVPGPADAANAPPPRDANLPPSPPDATEDAAIAAVDARASERPSASPPPGWRLVWSDEFEAAAGTSPDATKWKFVVSGNNANQELEFYTSRPENVAHDGTGNLAITAIRETYMNRSYTSARINTSGLFETTYGRFETRAKLPIGPGIWPAFWLLGANIGQVGWPSCGEIDVMENAGRDPGTNHGSLHGPGYSGGNDLTALYHLPAGTTFNDDFHVFAAEWEQNVVRFYVDDMLYETRTPTDSTAKGGRWVFDHPFSLILNLAVGGLFGGAPNATTVFPQTLLVDYVRVYAR
jgi:beta-glucanase (GH16 family)